MKLKKWLPVGGHIDADEAPDDALKREFEEETGLTVEVLGERFGSVCEGVKRVLAVPFAANVHNVGDHDHYGLFYGCRVTGGELERNERELNEVKWFAPEELIEAPEDVREQALKALQLYG